MVPQTEANLKIDPRQRAIWGHSYGGLFVPTRGETTPFSGSTILPARRLARRRRLLKDTQTLDATAFTGTSLYLLEGDGKAAGEPSGHEASLGVLRQTQQQLASNGLTVQFWRYPGLTHGQMFEVSLRAALLHLSGQPTLAHQ